MPEADAKPYTYVEANRVKNNHLVIKWFPKTEKFYSPVPAHLMILVTLLSLIAIINLLDKISFNKSIAKDKVLKCYISKYCTGWSLFLWIVVMVIQKFVQFHR